jgi:hypothetical protein
LITPSLPHLLTHTVESKLIDTHVAMIARVERYDAEKQVVDVQPQLKRRVLALHSGESPGDEERTVAESLPVLCNVPVLFPRAGGFFISFPIQRGDCVQLLFNDWPIDGWRHGDDPGDSMLPAENHGLHGAVAIPGIYPAAQALSTKDADQNALVIGKENGAQIHLTSSDIALGDATAKDTVALASKVISELQRIVTALNSHTHPPVVIGPGVTAPVAPPPTPLGPPNSVASTKVRAV